MTDEQFNSIMGMMQKQLDELSVIRLYLRNVYLGGAHRIDNLYFQVLLRKRLGYNLNTEFYEKETIL